MSKFNKYYTVFLVAVLCLIISSTSFAQNKKDLENKKKELQKEISLTNKLLNETKKKKETTLDELVKLKSKINARQELISTIHQGIKLVNKQISETQQNITSLQNELEKLKQ